MLYGFTFYLRGKDYFITTTQTKKTTKLASTILPLIGCSVTEGNIQALLFKMSKATCEIKTCQNSNRTEKRYYDISGDDFSGRGSWIDDGETIIINL
jgi:hypothetical protein